MQLHESSSQALPKRKCRRGLQAALLPLLLGAACTSYEVQLYGGYASTQISGDIGLSPVGNTVPPSDVALDVQDVLGFKDDVGSWYARAETGFGRVRLTLSGFEYNDRAEGTLTRSFGDIPSGTTIDTRLEMLNVKAAISYDVIDGDTFRLSPGLGVDYFNIEANARARTFNAFERLDVDAPVPMAFIQADLDLEYVAATVDAGGLWVNSGEVSGNMWDVEGMLRFKFIPNMELMGGYRWISFDSKGSADADGRRYEADLEFKGWFFGGGFTF